MDAYTGRKRALRVLSFVFCAVFLALSFVSGAFPLIASAENEETVFEVSDLAGFRRAFVTDETSYTVRLTNDITFNDTALYGSYTNTYDSCVTIEVAGDVTVDFAGHTVTYEQVYESDLYSTYHYKTKIDYTQNPRTYSYALKFVLHPQSERAGSTLRFTDSVGGGGVTMRSKLKSDVQLAAVYVANSGAYTGGTTTARLNRVVVDGGRFDLYSETKEHGKGTRDASNHFRGAFITDYMNTVINGGVFYARGDGSYSCRELAAFGTAVVYNASQRDGAESGFCHINGGTFDSDGYALHHFDPGVPDADGNGTLNTTRIMEYPKIENGVFKGRIGFVGMTYADSSGASSLVAKTAYEQLQIPVTTCYMSGKYQSGNTVNNPANMKLRDLHGIKELYVLNYTAFALSCSVPHPVDSAYFRIDDNVDTFRIAYELPDYPQGVTASPYIKIIYNGITDKYANTSEKTVSYADYTEAGAVTVRIGLDVKVPGYASKELGISYNIVVSVLNEPASINDQPQSCTVEVGKTAFAHVSAIYAASYLWQYRYDGRWYDLTDSFLAMFPDLALEGASTSTLRFTCETVAREQFRCKVTGTDGVVVTTNTVWLQFGHAPKVYAFAGGGYTAGCDAVFMLSGKDFGNVSYIVDMGKSYPATERFKTMSEFKTATGIDYSIKVGSAYSVLTVKNVPANISGKYKIGYEVTNAIAQNASSGAVTLDLETMLPLRLEEPKPRVTRSIEDAACAVGETCVFSFEAVNMTEAEWTFEKYDAGEEVYRAHTLDEMSALFPETVFTPGCSAENAWLTVENVQPGMEEYTLYAVARRNSASAFAGSAGLFITNGKTFADEDLNSDGLVNISDVTALLNALAGSTAPSASFDLNNDGIVNISDVSYLLNVLSG